MEGASPVTAIPSAAIVTGGAGAIGSQLVRHLVSLGVQRVVVVDDLSSGFKWLPPSDPAVELVVGDVRNLPELGIDGNDAWVFHLAAFFANQNSVHHPFDDLQRNGFGTLSVLDWASRHGVRRIVYASAGCSIVGHDANEPIREDMPVTLYMDTPYQITKALGEFYCNYYNNQVSTVRCRFFNSYGPGEVPGSYRNVIPNFIWKAMNGEPLVITGTGEETRDFIFVGDLIAGMVAAAATPDAHGLAFNLGTGIETRVIDLALAIVAGCNSASKIVYAPRRAWDHSLRRQANVDRATKVLGFHAGVSLDEGLGRTIEWFRCHHDDIAGSIGPER
jgi:nucleoside-diphosphate-sugar epimerase